MSQSPSSQLVHLVFKQILPAEWTAILGEAVRWRQRGRIALAHVSRNAGKISGPNSHPAGTLRDEPDVRPVPQYILIPPADHLEQQSMENGALDEC